MKGTLALARRHEVSIDSNYAALCVGVCVIGERRGAVCVGWLGVDSEEPAALLLLPAVPDTCPARLPVLSTHPIAVGFAQALDPVVNIMDAAAPCFLYHALTGRVSGRLYL